MANNNKEWISDLDSIEFNGREYPIRRVYVKTFGGVRTIAGESLEELLMKDGRYVSEEAERVDLQICQYVEDKYLNCGDKQLARHVERQVA